MEKENRGLGIVGMFVIFVVIVAIVIGYLLLQAKIIPEPQPSPILQATQ